MKTPFLLPMRIYHDAEGSGGPGAAAHPAPTTPTATPTAEPTTAAPPASPSSATPPPAPSAPATPAAPDQKGTLLSGAPAPAAGAPAPADDKAVAAFVESIKVDLGKTPDGQPVELDRDSIQALAPVALKHGIKPEALGEIIAAHYGYGVKQAQAAQERHAQIIATMKQQATQELGQDLPRFLSEAAKGGEFLLGKDLWETLSGVDAFGNDVRVIKAFAQLGRMVQSDGSIVGQGAGDEEKDFAKRWIESSNRKKE